MEVSKPHSNSATDGSDGPSESHREIKNSTKLAAKAVSDAFLRGRIRTNSKVEIFASYGRESTEGSFPSKMKSDKEQTWSSDQSFHTFLRNEDDLSRFVRNINSNRSYDLSRHLSRDNLAGKQWRKQRLTNKKISFSSVTIREYETILGDNPSCSSGPSLGIGWKYSDNIQTIPLDEYEAGCESPYTEPEMIVPRSEREEILCKRGYTNKEIADAVRSNCKAQKLRRRTIYNLFLSGIEEKVESVQRKLKKTSNFFLTRRKHDKYEFNDLCPEEKKNDLYDFDAIFFLDDDEDADLQ